MNSAPSITIQRFKKIREEQHYTQSEFAKILGIKGSTADIERGKTKISGQVVAKLLAEFKINPLWLFGESTQKTIEVNSSDVAPKVVTIDTEEQENMVLVNTKAAAGYPQNIQDVSWYQQLPAFAIPLPEYRNASYRGFQVEGDSMLPVLEPKEWVIGKAIGNLNEINSNAIYVVVLQDSVMVKKIKKTLTPIGTSDDASISLISINKEYAPYTIHTNQIQELWEVNSKLSFNVDAKGESADLKQLQDAMALLASEVRSLKK
ncbi:LexA family transcriptional regulator [Aquimarina sp. ERC-38]|uniref:XRE family transcriptional regulator n=1 Tax=Aquimarina sp. ERC-38 TaxID=2949996 RepID=UPI0022460C5E|nr:LexA family transcriptional regulator [Aquimarina sp. ERC-38]UZO81073.1 LexA family transcriptional regulator [Aquimarina sp. ERC-38]